MNELRVNDVDGCGSLTVKERSLPYSNDELRIRLGDSSNGAGSGTNFRDISRNDARRLRDWLDEWLGDTTVVKGYTPQDVERLVNGVELVLDDFDSSDRHSLNYLAGVLAPFLPPPDPDAELVEKMAKKAEQLPSPLNTEQGRVGAITIHNMRELLSVVREHDAAKS